MNTAKTKTWYREASELIPWGTQTNAKRLNPAWGDAMPAILKRGEGCRVWDLDDNAYIDYRCSLGPIILGHRFPPVEKAVQRQMQDGILFSMASPLELEAARAILRNVEWLEQIRFMKTGADVCTACTRLARAHTGRDHILTSGYHGYHDFFALNWPRHGVPMALKSFVHEVPYGDIDAMRNVFAEVGDRLAAAIVVPYEWNEDTGEEWLRELRAACSANGTVLIFDEVLTGFRLAPGGAAEYYGVVPDLAAFAKAMANGYPVSAFAGKREVMKVLEHTILTTTYAGETISLAASIATMEVMRSEPVHEHIYEMGRMLRSGFAEILAETGIPGHAAGLPPAPFIQFELGTPAANEQMQNRLFARLFESGVFPNDRWFINYSHAATDIEFTLEQIRKVLLRLA